MAMLDQSEVWFGTDGRAYAINTLNVEEIMWALDYSLANATKLRETWAFAQHQTYDTGQRARKWMLETPAVRAMLRRLVKIEDKEDAAKAAESFAERITSAE